MTLELFKKGIANDLRNALVKSCPVDTGRLKISIKVNIKGNKLIITMVDYALYVEFGTQPHIIRPKNKKALHWKNGKKDVFAKEVHHPGTKAQPFIRNTFYHKIPDIVAVNAARYLPEANVEVTYS
jgi:HK97 gp10 family phage protein